MRFAERPRSSRTKRRSTAPSSRRGRRNLISMTRSQGRFSSAMRTAPVRSWSRYAANRSGGPSVTRRASSRWKRGKSGRTDRSRLSLDAVAKRRRSEEHTSELQSRLHLVCRLLLEKKKKDVSLQQSHEPFQIRGRY